MKTLMLSFFLLVGSTYVYGGHVSDYYHSVGPSESLIARFDHSIEATTVNEYNGYLWLHFSGYGYNNPSEVFDSFYFFSPIIRKQGLGIAFDGKLVVDGSVTHYEDHIGENTDLIDIHNSLWQIVYNNDVGLHDGLNISGFPNFRSDHEYDIVLLVNSFPRIINFGFLDGGTYDNSGQVNILLTPVNPNSIPEPASLVLLMTSMVVYLIFRFCRC